MNIKIILLTIATLVSFGTSAQITQHPDNTIIGTPLKPAVKLEVKGKQSELFLRSYNISGGKTSSAINLQNKYGNWHMSGPRTYDGKNQFSIFWNNGQNFGNGSYFRYFTITDEGNVGIGTHDPDSKLTVKGKIHAREVKVTVNAGSDFVFDKDYNLPTLHAVAKYINENKHLPEIASAKEMEKGGIHLAEFNMKLLQKIEELTLYMIEQEKQMVALKEKVQQIEDQQTK